MWQVLLGIYIIVILLSTVLLWSSLMVAKRSDHNALLNIHPRLELNMHDEGNTTGRHAFPIPTLREFSE